MEAITVSQQLHASGVALRHILPVVAPPAYSRHHNVLIVGDGNFSFAAGFIKRIHQGLAETTGGRRSSGVSGDGGGGGGGGVHATHGSGFVEEECANSNHGVETPPGGATPEDIQDDAEVDTDAGGCVCATSFDSRDTVLRKYPEAAEHLGYLKSCDRANRPVVVAHDVDAKDLPMPRDLLPACALGRVKAGWDYIIFNFPLAPTSDGLHQVNTPAGGGGGGGGGGGARGGGSGGRGINLAAMNDNHLRLLFQLC